MIPTVFVVTGIGVWAAYKIFSLSVENKNLKEENTRLRQNRK